MFERDSKETEIHACYEATGADDVLQRAMPGWGYDCDVIVPRRANDMSLSLNVLAFVASPPNRSARTARIPKRAASSNAGYTVLRGRGMES